MNDFVKAAVILPAYAVVGPLIGVAIAGKRNLERLVFCAMLGLTAMFPTKFTLMLYSIEKYRGHVKGFEFSFIEVLAIALIVAAFKRASAGPKFFVPCAASYLTWCALMTLSLSAAYEPIYAWMGVVKYTKAVLLIMAGFHFLRDEKDIAWLARTSAFMLLFMAFTCLKMRLIEGRFRTVGTFEHQNPMAMWCYFLALPTFAYGLKKETSNRDAWLCFSAVAGGGICVLLSVSRAALGAFAIGAALVLGLAFLRGPSKRAITISILGGIAGVLVAMVALDSVFERMKEEKDREASGEEDLRVVMIDQAKAMLNDSAVGIGWNNYGIANSRPHGKYSQILEDWDASRGFTIYEENYVANPLTESYYWLILGENGYPGFAGCMLFLAATLLVSWRALRWHWRTTAGWFVGGLLVSISLHYGHSLIERVLVQTKNLSVWLMMIGVAGKLDWLRRQKQKLPPG
jgi:hypothetical protein